MTRSIAWTEQRIPGGHTRYRQITRGDANDSRPMFLY